MKLGFIAGVAVALGLGLFGCDGNTVAEADVEYDDIAQGGTENPSNGTRTSSNSKVASSSSRASMNVVESSSAKSLSSSSEGPVETLSWISTTYKTARVVAENADKLKCDDVKNTDDLSGYEVAYEFNNPNDLGRDYIGNNNAYIEDNVPPVSAACGNIIFNGENGLLIPLNDTFNSKGFVIEVRFMPTEPGIMGNIFVAEPPGSGVDGWQVRLDGSDVVFHMRDTSIRSSWETPKIGTVSMNEWHVVRVKVFPVKSAVTGKTVYSMNASLDGVTTVVTQLSERINIDVDRYGLGIGYDSMHQSLHADRFFTGKIDYIRYGRIAEKN